jgi:hypothetical protein
MDLDTLEPYILDEWCYIPVAVAAMITALALGLLMGWIWASL